MSDDWWATPAGVQTVLREEIKIRNDRIEELEADLRKMALDYLAAEGQAAEAYQAQLEAEAKLANIAHAVWTEHKDWEGERKYALRQIVKWLVRAGQD
jgi:hypothetical protein